jgi:hypothetical protein
VPRWKLRDRFIDMPDGLYNGQWVPHGNAFDVPRWNLSNGVLRHRSNYG